MAEPSERDITSAIAEFNSDRGWIINSFSQVECRLADLIIQCQGIADYEELNQLPLPMGVGSRITRVRELMKSGPLSAHAAPLEKLLQRLEEFEELRHLMTHGYAAFHFTPDGDMGMTFVRSSRQRGASNTPKNGSFTASTRCTNSARVHLHS